MNSIPIYAFFVILGSVAKLISGGYEHNCTKADYERGAQGSASTCSSELGDRILQHCFDMGKRKRDISSNTISTNQRVRQRILNAFPLLKNTAQMKDDIFQSQSKANEFLSSQKRDDYYYYQEDSVLEPQSVVCECCIHWCTVPEIDEYCWSLRRKRSANENELNMDFKTLLNTLTNPKPQVSNLLELTQTPFIKALDHQKSINIASKTETKQLPRRADRLSNLLRNKS